MAPVGKPPRALVEADDQVFDLQCLADTQCLNTKDMLETLGAIFADGLVDERDTENVLRLRRHAKLEHQMNEQQFEGCQVLRKWMNSLSELVSGLRLRLQNKEAAVGDLTIN